MNGPRYYVDPHRRTGRTTRMVDAAREALKQGKTVYILMNTMRETGRIRDALADVKTGKLVLSTLRLQKDLYQWRDNRIMGAPRDSEVFIDHHASD